MESEVFEGTAAPVAVVWTSPGVEVPEELRAALARGGLRVARAGGVYTALAALCRLDRESAADARVRCALVLVNPGELESPGALCGAAEKYAGSARFWMYTSGATRLRAVTPEDLEGWRARAAPGAGGPRPGKPQPYKPGSPHPNPSVTITRPAAGVGISRTGSAQAPPVQAADAPPTLRLAGGGATGGVEAGGGAADGSGAGEAGTEAPDRPRPVLTPEELEMLLREDD